MQYLTRLLLPLCCGVFCLLINVFSLQAQPSPKEAVSQAPQTDEAALRALTEQLYAAYLGQQSQAYFQLWSAQAPQRATRQRLLQRYWQDPDKRQLHQLTITQLEQKADRAELRVMLEFQLTWNGKLETRRQQRRLESVREAGGWRVWFEASAEEEFAAQLAELATANEQSVLLADRPTLHNSELAQALLAQGRLMAGGMQNERAIQLFQLAAQLGKTLNDTKTRGQAVNNLGVIFGNQGNFAAAIAALEESLTLKPPHDWSGRALTLNNIGNNYMEQGEYDQAIEYHRQSFALRAAHHDLGGQASSLGNWGNDYYRQGNFRLALEFYQKALAFGKASDPSWLAGTLNNVGNVYRYQGDYELAIDYYERALAQAQSAQDQLTEAMVKNNLGTAYFYQSKYEQAETIYRASLAMRPPDDLDGIASVLNNLGVLAQERRDFTGAQAAFEQSLKLREQLHNPVFIAESLINLATNAWRAGRLDDAVAPAERALALARRHKAPDLLWQASVTAGQIYRARQQPEKACALFNEAIQTVEAMREQVAGASNQQALFFENKIAAYYQMTEMAWEQKRPVEALAYAERAKARVLLDVLQRGPVNITKAMTASEEAEERQLRAHLTALNSQLARARVSPRPDAARLTDLEAQLPHARAALESFQNTLYATHPGLQVQRSQVNSFDLTAAKALLTAENALLEYVVLDARTLLFVITANASGQPLLNVYELPVARSPLNKAVTDYRQLLAQRQLNFRPAAAQLYAMLLQPAAAQLAGKKQLVIVRDAQLWELPFQALTMPDGRYLLEAYALSYAPSLTALVEMQQLQRTRQQRNSKPRLLALGNPSLNGSLPADELAQRGAAVLTPLPSAATEVTQLAKLYAAPQSKIYLGTAAREERFKAEAGQADILHLATHALLNNTNPLYSQIVLAQNDGGELANGTRSEAVKSAANKEDGLLEAWEVLQLNLRAELVVLSACETGRGRVGAGEGLLGLTWAFFVAGAPASIVSQWKVDAASTAILMQDFHRTWRTTAGKPPSKAEALRLAALKMLRTPQYRHPFFWASFSLLGAPL